MSPAIADDVRTFRAASMQEALDVVRREMGTDAVILSTRQIEQERKRPWRRTPSVVEITAGFVDLVRKPKSAYDALKNPQPIEPKPTSTDAETLHAQLLDRLESLERAFAELQSRSEVTAGNPPVLPDGVSTTGIGPLNLQCTGGITLMPGHRHVVALVGPTGVGKTTTIAKLAADFRLRKGVSVGLLTVDTYRIAAVEQLRTYAEIIDLPMKVVTNSLEMQRALDELADVDLVLIDTAGRSPHDELKIGELRGLLNAGDVSEVHLVLSCTSGAENLSEIATRFAPVNPSAVLLTKLDEVERLPGIPELPVSYLTNGQGVPDDIEIADSDRLAALLGQEVSQ